MGLILGVLYILQSVLLYQGFTYQHTGANDFFSRWYGARALLLQGRDPYALDVAYEVLPLLSFPPEEVSRGGFAYPLPVLFTFWPLAYLPYEWAQAFWMTALQWITIALVLSSLRLEQWRPKPLGLVAIVLGTLLFYPVARTILLGQFTLHITLFILLTLLALQRGNDAWAGVALAATVIKPQMVIVVAPWLLLWTLAQRRWRFLGGLLFAGGALLLSSMMLFPRWPLSFIEDLQRYAEVAGGRSPLLVLSTALWPGGAELLSTFLAGLLVLAMLAAWWRGVRQRESVGAVERALYWTLLVSLLIPFQTGTTNQAMLLIPLLSWLRQAWEHGWRVPAILAALALLVLPWLFFLNTVIGIRENDFMFVLIPLACLVILVGIEIYDGQRRVQQNTNPKGGAR